MTEDEEEDEEQDDTPEEEAWLPVGRMEGAWGLVGELIGMYTWDVWWPWFWCCEV